jgi:hypothetical protein
VVFATRPRAEAVELMEVDFQLGERRPLTMSMTPSAFAVVEGAAPTLVVLGGGGLTWMPLSPAMPGESAPAAPAALTAAAAKSPPTRSAAARDDDWRARLAPSRPTTRPATTQEAAPEREPTHWRDRLCDWARHLSRKPTTPVPELPARATVAKLIERLALDATAARTLMALYGSRLVGAGDGLSAAAVVEVIRSGDDEVAWAEALGRGLLGTLGVATARQGKLRLTAAAARFLDGAAPRITIVAGRGGNVELPSGNVRVDGGVSRLRDVGAELAERYGYDVALVSVDTRRALQGQLAEARMHGAWPVVEAGKSPTGWIDGLDDGPTVVVVRGEPSGVLAQLPEI